MRRRKSRAIGFTLIEVLVALSIVAIALAAGAQATAALSLNAQRQSDMVLASLCAENQLARVRLSPDVPAIGEQAIACTQAGTVFNVVVATTPTLNPNFRRVDVRVTDAGNVPLLQVSTVASRF